MDPLFFGNQTSRQVLVITREHKLLSEMHELVFGGGNLGEMSKSKKKYPLGKSEDS